MIVFDAVIGNTDRHLGNFGFLVQSGSNRLAGPAPLFDHGLSLLTYAMEDDLSSWESYAATRTPAAYTDFLQYAVEVAGQAQKEKLEAYKRELERKMITNSSSTSKIEVLESKIKTLETALQNALKK